MMGSMMILGMWLQEAGSISAGNSRLLMFFVGMVAVAMLFQAIVVVVAAVIGARTAKRLMTMAEEARERALPLVNTTQSMLHDLHPKVRTITDNLVETSHVVRAKAQEFDATLSGVNQRARAQSERVDDMVSTVLDTTSGIASTITKGVQIPVREFYGLMSGLKAGIDVLVGRGKNGASGRYPDDPSI